MERSASKRRKLSPSASATASPSTTGRRPTTRNGVSRPGHRPSFTTPTKASLARFNPDLLSPVRPIDPPKSTSKKPPNGQSRTLNVNGKGNTLPGASGPSTRTGIDLPMGESNEAPDDGYRVPATRKHLSASPRRRSKTPTIAHTPSKVAQTQPAPSIRPSSPQATGTAPQSERNHPADRRAPATRGHEPPNGIAIDMSNVGNLPNTPTHHGVPSGVNGVNDAEPSLPSTPLQMGLEAPSERPKGLLFGRPDKQKEKSNDGPSSSISTKPAPTGTFSELPSTSILGPKVFLPGLPRPVPTFQQANLQKKITSCTHIEKETLKSGSSYLKDALLSSWQTPGEKETLSQQRQRKKLIELSAKLLRLREEIDQLRTNAVDIEDVSRDQTAHFDAVDPSKSLTSTTLRLSQKLSQFFPFSQTGRAKPSAATLSSVTQDAGEIVQISNSKLINDRADDVDTPIQSHDVEFLSNGSVQSALQITINTQDLTIHNLKLLNRTPPPSQELKTWILDPLRSNEISSIGTALNRSSHVLSLRTTCWRSCYERHADLTHHTSLNNDSNLHNQQTITFQRHPLSLSITWAIRLRNDGQAESKLSLKVDIPPAWVDEGIFSGQEGENVREAFELLVKERGVTEAVGGVVKVLFQS